MRALALGLSEQNETSLHDMLTPIDVVACQTSSMKVMAYRGAAISGDAKYDDGTPAAEITISAWEVGVRGKLISVRLTATTYDRGNYRIAGLCGGKFTLKAPSPEMHGIRKPHVYRVMCTIQRLQKQVRFKKEERYTRYCSPSILRASAKCLGDNTPAKLFSISCHKCPPGDPRVDTKLPAVRFPPLSTGQSDSELKI
jgi:hypothetical protein